MSDKIVVTVETKRFMRDIKLPEDATAARDLMAGMSMFLVVRWVDGQVVNIDSGHDDARRANRCAALLSMGLEGSVFEIKLSALTDTQRVMLATAVDMMDRHKRGYADAVHMRKQTRRALYRLNMLYGTGPFASLTPSGIAAGRAAIAYRDAVLAERDAR